MPISNSLCCAAAGSASHAAPVRLTENPKIAALLFFIPAPSLKRRWAPMGSPPPSFLLRFGDRLRHHLRISTEPVSLLDELPALDLEDLHPTAAFVIGRRDVERRHQAPEAEIMDLLEALLDVFAGRRAAAIG